jgi:hypothetical protein
MKLIHYSALCSTLSLSEAYLMYYDISGGDYFHLQGMDSCHTNSYLHVSSLSLVTMFGTSR